MTRPAQKLALAALCALGLASRARAESLAFHYGAEVPEELFATFDRVVVEPEHGAPLPVPAGAVAYLSVGEVSDTSPSKSRILPEWVLGRNPAWASSVMDLASAGYARHLLDERLERLVHQGYRAVFLDTLDSYQLAAKSDAERRAQASALVRLVRAMATRHPELRIYLNRGFELLGELKGVVHGVVAESLFSAYRAADGSYGEVPAADRAWLTQKLDEARRVHGLPVFVIDYQPVAARAAMREDAARIVALGYTPWVSDGTLTSVGLGSLEILPRRVAILGDGPPTDDVRALLPVLEHLGCKVELHDLHAGLPRLPSGLTRGLIVARGPARAPLDGAALERFLVERARLGERVVLMGDPGFVPSEVSQRAFGLEPLSLPRDSQRSALHVGERDALVGFETEPPKSRFMLLPLRVRHPSLRAHLVLRDGSGAAFATAATASWGGALLSHYRSEVGLEGERGWAVDPYAFLQLALGLDDLPRPDATTEQGARLAVVALRPDGMSDSARTAGRPRVSQLLAKSFARTGRRFAIDPRGATGTRPSDRAEAEALRARAGLARCDLPPSASVLAASSELLSALPALGPDDKGVVHMPWPDDAAFIPAGVDEAYPYARVKALLARTEHPRRLTPIALDLHAYALSSPGGLALVDELDGLLAALPARLVTPDGFAARARDLQRAVVVRDLAGRYGLRGTSALRTLRLPRALGAVDIGRSEGVATVSPAYEGSYVSFLGQGGFLATAPTAGAGVTLTRSDAELLDVKPLAAAPAASGPGALAVRLRADGETELALAGAGAGATCSAQGAELAAEARADATGAATLRVRLHGEADVIIRCRVQGGRRD